MRGSGKHEGPVYRKLGHPEAIIKAGVKLQEKALLTLQSTRLIPFTSRPVVSTCYSEMWG